ncbi:hypothetical protein [Parvularcula dongshanensis]|uniref:hypothetical protein n=1 Tax=Parvularcula dongshanensis TaxID=1173995 RepID=UPI001615F9A7|nr:hypothetical protein [Parvularcula dongshanensis]
MATPLRAYLEKVLHTRVKVRAWGGADGLPVFLARGYDFAELVIERIACLVMSFHGDAEPRPSNIEKHVRQVRNVYEGPVAFASSSMSSTFRDRLIEAGVPFIVPGNQLYFPELAIDLREHFISPAPPKRDQMAPATQAVFFHYLLNPEDWPMPVSELAGHLGYSAMTVGRAFDELAGFSLGRIQRSGRVKLLRFRSDPKTLIDSAKTLLTTPVLREHRVRWRRDPEPLQLGGLSALGELSMIDANELRCYAVSQHEAKRLKGDRTCEEVDVYVEAEARLEVWRYDPRLLSRDRIVDPLSLYAQFWNDPDERVSGAAYDMLENLEW